MAWFKNIGLVLVNHGAGLKNQTCGKFQIADDLEGLLPRTSAHEERRPLYPHFPPHRRGTPQMQCPHITEASHTVGPTIDDHDAIGDHRRMLRSWARSLAFRWCQFPVGEQQIVHVKVIEKTIWTSNATLATKEVDPVVTVIVGQGMIAPRHGHMLQATVGDKELPLVGAEMPGILQIIFAIKATTHQEHFFLCSSPPGWESRWQETV